MPCDRTQPGKLAGDHQGGEMHVVVGLHAHLGARKSGTDELADSFGGDDGLIHGASLAIKAL